MTFRNTCLSGYVIQRNKSSAADNDNGQFTYYDMTSLEIFYGWQNEKESKKFITILHHTDLKY